MYILRLLLVSSSLFSAASFHTKSPHVLLRPALGRTWPIARTGDIAVNRRRSRLLSCWPQITAITMSTTEDCSSLPVGHEEVDENGQMDSCPTPEVRTPELFRFIVPTLAGWLSSEVMSVVDTAVVGSCSAAELAALGPATMLTDSSAYLFFWLNVATTSLFATSLAKGRAAEAWDVLSDALWLSLACGLLMTTVVATFGPGALVAICASAPEVVPAATQYLRIRLLGLPAFMAGMVLQAACLGAKDSVSPLVVLLACGALNLGLDLYLVKTLGMGIGGAAIATLAAQLLQTLLLAIVVKRKRTKLVQSREAAAGPRDADGEIPNGWLLIRARPDFRRLGVFLSFAGPIFLVLLGKISCYNAMTLAATASGVTALAAHQAMISVFFLGCKFGDAVSQTAQAYLPACLGKDDSTVATSSTVAPAPAQRLSFRLLRLATGLGAFISLAAYVFAMRLPTVFTQDPLVISRMLGVAPFLFAALLLHASCMCSEGLLLGYRQLKFLASSYAANVAVFLSALYWIASRKLGLRAVWGALATFQLVRLTMFSWRLRSVGLAFRGQSGDGAGHGGNE